MNTIWFDFDGTIVDIRKRFNSVHRKICTQIGIKPMSDENYWNCRCEGVPTIEILKKINSQNSYQVYIELRNKLLESEECLRLDSLRPNTDTTLKFLRKKYSLKILSGRSNHKNLIQQTEWLEIKKYFSDFHTVSPFGDWKEKSEVLSRLSKTGDIMIGDTSKDILAGKSVNLQTIAIKGGMSTINIIETSIPNQIISDLSELTKIL